jgi:ABC-type uncharacterized transport system permease subunit
MEQFFLTASLLFSFTLSAAAPFMFTAMGGILNERAGVVNIGLEGMMTAGAWTGAVVAYFTHQPWLAFMSAGLAGMLFALLHAIACIHFRANQVVSGIAINFLSPGIVIFINRLIFNGSVSTNNIPLEDKMPRPLQKIFVQGSIWDNLVNFYSVVYLAFLVVFIVWYLLYHTRLGLRIRAVGENPEAADTLGINVYGLRYFSVLGSGLLSGFGGACLSLAVVSGFRPSIISGQGFIALAAVIFGKWHPLGAMWSCLLFGFANGLVVFLGGPSMNINISPHLLSMVPYLITLIALVTVVGYTSAPRALGQPYMKS